MNDIDSIRKRLFEAGFKNVIPCKYREGLCPNIMKLDYLPEDSLWIEAVK